MGPIKPHRRKSKKNVKGLFACEICEQDYTNGSNLVNHMAQHEGITYTCDKCDKVFQSQKSFDNHARTHSDGLLTCDQCGKTFQYLGSLSNHFKTHTNKVYVCECEDCAKRNKSYSMYLEHIQYGHAETLTIQCTVYPRFFQTLTQMCTHRNKAHGPAAP